MLFRPIDRLRNKSMEVILEIPISMTCLFYMNRGFPQKNQYIVQPMITHKDWRLVWSNDILIT